jgi:hypothetical protein
MQPLATLTEFLEASGCRLHLFDMGRRVVSIPRDRFVDFETNKLPYPLPLRQQAWFGLLFHDLDDSAAESFVWFLRFPLDEQAKLVLAARDGLIQRLLESLDKTDDQATRNARMQAALQDNPHAFQPKSERMAMFHAKVTAALRQPASRYYSHVCDYFSGHLGWDQWAFLGYQGIADLAARLDQDGNQERLTAAIPKLPAAPLEALCHCLENVVIPPDIAQALLARTQATLAQSAPDPQILEACLRGIACTSATALRQDLIGAVLCHDEARRSDLLVAISGRAWEALLDIRLRDQFLERLANNDRGVEFFNSVLSDLLFLPDIRANLLSGLRQADRSERLSAAIGGFFQAIKAHGD